MISGNGLLAEKAIGRAISFALIPSGKHASTNETDNRVPRLASLPPSMSWSRTIHLQSEKIWGSQSGYGSSPLLILLQHLQESETVTSSY